MGLDNWWWNWIYGSKQSQADPADWKITTTTTAGSPYPQLPPVPQNLTSPEWAVWQQGYDRWKAQVFPGQTIMEAPDLPDEFDSWVEEVRKQNRMEELVTAVYKVVMAGKKDGTE
jgi:hypothetical protein